MNAEDPNPAATPTPCEDIQGDGRWMSLVCKINYITEFICMPVVFYMASE